MREYPIFYYPRDVGCYADGAFGSERIRERLESMLRDVANTLEHESYAGEPHSWDYLKLEGEALERENQKQARYRKKARELRELAKELEGEASDDMSEIDEALEALSDFTHDSLAWVCYAGDMLLMTLEESEAL